MNGRENVEVDGSLLHDEVGAPTSMDLPNMAELGLPRRGRQPEAREATPSPVPGRVLVLLADGRELERVQKDRFVIGRGKHCDLIGSDWFIEDLGSSNGTWFDKRRISRRQIQDGDEYYICAEKLSCVFR